MYTYESKFFSQDFKEKTILAVKKARSFLVPEDFIEQCNSPSEAETVSEWGHRWTSDEECFQAAVMFLSSLLIGSRGPGFATEEEVKQIELSLDQTGAYQGLSLDQIAKEGVLGAIRCDYWYTFEKPWE